MIEPILTSLSSPSFQKEAEETLRHLTEISSHSADRAGCQQMASALCDLLRLRGLSVRREPDPTSVYGDHVVFHSEGQGPQVLLIGHLDTVFSKHAFSGYRESEEAGIRYAHGPGVYDMKGGLVSIIFALRALAQAGLLPSLSIVGVIVSDEEVGSPSSKGLIERLGQGAHCALDFESGRKGDAIITRRKGLGALRVSVRGKAAHAGNAHDEGKNAIWALCKFVDRAQGLTDYQRGITVNVGKVAGGHGRNVVPDHAEAEVDFRFVELADATWIDGALKQAAIEAQEAVPGTQVSLSGGVHRRPMVRTPASEALMRRYGQCQVASGLGFTEAPLLGGGSDASSVPEGIPVIDGLGPRGHGFHTLEERVELATLLPKAQALVRFLLGSAPTP